jgi:hypothetical protein
VNGQVEMEYHKSKSFIRKKKICGTINEPGIDAKLLTQTKQMKAKNVVFVINSVPVMQNDGLAINRTYEMKK